MASSSGKYMFRMSSSDNDSSDSDDEIGKRRGGQKQRSPIKIPTSALCSFSKSKLSGHAVTESAAPERTATRYLPDEGEPGLFVIDSTGSAGDMGIRDDGEKKWPEPSPLDPGVDLTKNLYINLDRLKRTINPRRIQDEEDTKDVAKDDLVNELMKKATFKPTLEKNPHLPLVSKSELKRRRKAEREKTKGSDWFNLPATELTEERKRDLEVMQFRDVLDPKSRYRSDDRSVLPKYFQVGTVVEHAADFYHSRLPRKERKQTLVDELLADAEFQKRSKRKYSEIMQKKTRYRGGDNKGGNNDKIKKKRKLKY